MTVRKIAVINQKGGTGKTTTAAMIASGLARIGKKTLLIDMDPQGSIAVWFDIKFTRNLYHLIVEKALLADCIYHIRDGLDCIPCGKTLAQAELFLARREDRLGYLRGLLEPITGYDFVIIDCAPSLNMLNVNSLLYAQEVFIPVTMDFFSLVGAKEAMDNLGYIRTRLGHDVRIGMIIPTFFDKRDRKSAEVLGTLKKHFNGLVTEPVRKNVRLSEAVGAHKDIFEYAPESHGAADYDLLVRKVVGNG